MERKIAISLVSVLVLLLGFAIYYRSLHTSKSGSGIVPGTDTIVWKAPQVSSIPHTSDGNLILYGRALVVNTSYYFGPKGIIANAGNGMNCQNCHLQAGTKMFGNNFSKVAHGYPRFKARSASMESIEKKVEDCFERSMNGNPIDSTGREMKAIVAYLNWVGSEVPPNENPPGSGIQSLPIMNRAADPYRGKLIFINKCQVCHGKQGEGQLNPQGYGYLYPPLWGKISFNTGASIYRISKLAGFIRNNMPFGTTYKTPVLSVEDCWDVAAFIDSNMHPVMNTRGDYPDIRKKPFDDPDGPYPDSIFSEKQHKYGPYGPIIHFDDSLKHILDKKSP